MALLDERADRGTEEGDAMGMINVEHTSERVSVVRCVDCKHCTLLNDGKSFDCAAWEMDFYAPRYSAQTYYCADGERRE